MLEGLEVNVRALSELFNDEDETFRLDAEHYRRRYIQTLKFLSQHKTLRIKDFISQPVMTGHTPSMGVERFYGGKIKFIKTDNLRENSIGGEYSHYLSKEGNSTIKRTSLQKDDVLTTIIGATEKIIGRTSIIQEDILPANINQNIALIRINHDIISPSYVNIYLLSPTNLWLGLSLNKCG